MNFILEKKHQKNRNYLVIFMFKYIKKMNFEGVITFIGEQTEVGQNNLPKITFVVEENNDKEYKSSLAVDLLWEKVDMIKAHKVGDAVKLGLNFRTSEYNGRHFTNISAWRIEPVDGSAPAAAPAADKSNEDLPF